MKQRLFNIGVAIDQLGYTLITLGAGSTIVANSGVAELKCAMTYKQKLQAPTSEATYN